MGIHRITALILCMALLLALCLPAVCAAEIMPFAETGNKVNAILSFSNGKANGAGRATALEAGCTAKTTVYVQEKSNGKWKSIASGSGTRDASASCTAQTGTEYRAYAVMTVYNSNGVKVDSVSGYSTSQTY